MLLLPDCAGLGFQHLFRKCDGIVQHLFRKFAEYCAGYDAEYCAGYDAGISAGYPAGTNIRLIFPPAGGL